VRDEVVTYCESMNKRSHLTKSKLIGMLGIHRDKYYDWLKRLGTDNNHNGKIPKKHWLTPEEIQSILDYANEKIGESNYYLHEGYRRLTYMGLDENRFACSPASVYRVLKKHGLLNRWNRKSSSKKGNGFNQPEYPHQQWHTDIKYINYKGAFLFFISIIDGYSRYIVHHEIRRNMTEQDVSVVIQRALEKFPKAKPRIISDNGSQYISKEFGLYMKEVGLQHIRTSVNYPQSNGKIERFHRTLDNECIKTSSFINIDDANRQVSEYIDYYNNKRLHSSLYYLRPVDFINGNVDELISKRNRKIDNATNKRNQYWKNKRKEAA
jgi:putative transposase